MTTFNRREDAFEKKFVHDEDLQFKAMARRNKALALWAAEKLGRSGDQIQTYISELIAADLQEGGDEDVFRKIRADFDAAGVTQSDHQIRRTMDEMLQKAIAEVKITG
jgi:hypothetical protein